VNPHQPVHAAFGFQPAIGVGAVDPDGRLFQPGLLSAALFDPFCLVAVDFRPADIPRQRSSLPQATIMNCIGNHPSLFLQRVYSETLLKIVAPTLSPVRPPAPFLPRVITHCHHHTHRPTVPNSPIGRNIECEEGNSMVNISFRIDI
jgi:hypothetical protein